ncbi:MAG TPA: hypothetical protein VHG29_04585 [Novosphingobium sp.]|nr:hypothetical protein [Novosphingobium sp.]
MSYWQKINPGGAIADFITVFRDAGRNRWRISAVAAATTFGIFSIMAQESWRIPPPKPELTYITSWHAGRSDAEIVASNIENQRIKDAKAKLEKQNAEDVRQMYKTLGRYSGMDVDAIEAKARADEAAEQAAKQQQAPVAAN